MSNWIHHNKQQSDSKPHPYSRSRLLINKRKRRDREGSSGRWPGYVMFTICYGICCVHKFIFNPAEVSFFWQKSVFRDVRLQSCLALRFLMTLCPLLHEIFAFLSNIRLRLACMRTSRKTDFMHARKKDFSSSINNFSGHDISQGLDREPPSLSPHFLLLLIMPLKTAYLS